MKILEAFRNILIACKLLKPNYYKWKQDYIRFRIHGVLTFFDLCIMQHELVDLVDDLEEPDLSKEIIFLINEELNIHNILGLQCTLHKFSKHPNRESIMNEIRKNPNYLKFDNLEAYIELPPLTQEQRKLLINKYRLNEIETDFTNDV